MCAHDQRMMGENSANVKTSDVYLDLIRVFCVWYVILNTLISATSLLSMHATTNASSEKSFVILTKINTLGLQK